MGRSRVYGDWDNVLPRLQLLKSQMTPLVAGELKEFSKKFNEEIKKHIDANDLGLPSLAEYTVKKKGHSKPWLESGYFKDHLSIEEVKGKNKYVIRMGALDSVPYPSKHPGMRTMFDLATKLEYGWGRIPARPLFAKSIKEMAPQIKKFEKLTGAKFQGLWDKGAY